MKPMLLRTNKENRGFTLIELLIATAILGGLAVVGTQLLWDTITTRAKQSSLEGAQDNFRLVASTLTRAIQSAKSVNVSNATTIEIRGEPCRTVRLTGITIEQAIDSSSSCLPPTSGFVPLTKTEMNIQSLDFSPIGSLPKTVTIKIGGIYKDGLGEHPLNFQTTVAPRITL